MADIKKYDVIAFDLDGTLSDPARGLIQGFVYCFKKLGLPYENGEGTKEDILKAIYWYTKAEIDGSYDAKERLDILLQRK